MATYHIAGPGEFVHAWITKADTEYNDEGLYHVKLAMEAGPKCDALKQLIDGYVEEAFAQQTSEMKPAQAAKWEKYTPYQPEEDEEGNETGRTLFVFKQNKLIKLRSGEVKEVSIEVRDSKDKVITVPVFSGTTGRIMFKPRAIVMSGEKAAGVRLDFAKVQVIKLSQGGAGGMGFGEVEGGYEGNTDQQGFGEQDGDY